MVARKVQGLTEPRSPQVPAVTSVQQIMPNVHEIVRRKPANMVEGFALKPEEKVVLLTDTTIDPIINEALAIAIRDAGGIVETIILEGHTTLTDPVDLVDTMFSNCWYPEWVWSAAAEADVFVNLAFLKFPHTPNLPLTGKKPRVIGWELPSDLLASRYVTFPVELRDAIGKKTWDLMYGATEIQLTDPLGTDLRFKLTPEDWTPEGKAGDGHTVSYRPGHLMLPLPPKHFEGVLVTTSITFGGPIPSTKLTIQGRQVTKVEGGGKFGETLREFFDKYKDDIFPGKSVPGANWLSTFGICTNPKAWPSPAFERLAGSARVHAWTTGHRRSGIIHTAVGMAMCKPRHKVIRHVDLQFSTLLADKNLVIDKGHLTALDDPEVRQVAARFGDPDELLYEEWIPGVIG